MFAHVVLTRAPDRDSGTYAVTEMDSPSQRRTPMVDSPRVGGVRPGESREPGGSNSSGGAHLPEMRVHVGP